jgi:hypothetical protein
MKRMIICGAAIAVLASGASANWFWFMGGAQDPSTILTQQRRCSISRIHVQQPGRPNCWLGVGHHHPRLGHRHARFR